MIYIHTHIHAYLQHRLACELEITIWTHGLRCGHAGIAAGAFLGATASSHILLLAPSVFSLDVVFERVVIFVDVACKGK